MRIRTKIIIYFLAAFAFIVGLSAGITGESNTRALRKISLQNIQGVFEMRTDQVRRFIDDQKALISVLSQEDGFQEFLITGGINTEYVRDSQDILINYLRDNPNFNELFILDSKGKVVLSTDKTQLGQLRNTDQYFINGLKSAYIKSIYLSPITHQLAYALSAPVVDSKTGKALGVIVARVHPDNFFGILTDRSGLGKTGETFLINSELTLITPSFFIGNNSVLNQKIETENAKSCFDPKEIAKYENSPIDSHANQPPVRSYSDYRDIKIFGTHSYFRDTGWCLIAKIDQSEIYAPIIQQAIVSAVINLSGAIIFVILGLLIAKIITRPIEFLRRGTEIIEKGNLNYKVLINSKDEIGQLSRSFDIMVDTLKKSKQEVDKRVEEQTKEIIERSNDLQKFQLAVENVSDQIVISDPEGIMLYANPVTEKVTGYSPKEAVGKKAGSLWGKKMEKKFYQQMWKTIKIEKKSFIGEINNQRRNGENYTAAISISPILDENKNVKFFVGIERDITKAKAIDRMKTEFISLASHQLRTPLSAMKWFAEMLLYGDAGKLNKEQDEYVENIYQSNERMIALVNGLLNTSRIESGRIIIDPKQTCLGDLVEEVIKEIKNMIDEKKQRITIEIDSKLPNICIDAKLIREVYKNLLTNAVKYTQKEGKISISVSVKGDYIISQVSDTGYGIPKEEQEKVYEKFYRGTNILKYETEGTGLGLYLAKAIVESSGGKIWFESEENKGTTFWFSIPLKGSKSKNGEVSIDS